MANPPELPQPWVCLATADNMPSLYAHTSWPPSSQGTLVRQAPSASTHRPAMSICIYLSSLLPHVLPSQSVVCGNSGTTFGGAPPTVPIKVDNPSKMEDLSKTWRKDLTIGRFSHSFFRRIADNIMAGGRI